ncbi:MAG: NADPH:quinone oxidoreductase family protein [Kofleriaceae bacterium]
MGQRVVISQLGATPMEAVDRFSEVLDQDAPIAGEGECVVKIESACVGWVDLIMAAGQYQHKPVPPYTPGMEFAGTIVGTGERVVVDPFLTGVRTSGPYRQWGGFASYALAPKQACIPIPDHFSFDEAANLLGNYETAVHCLITRGRLAAGETVLIHGASGAVGLAAVHVAKLVGATVIATGRSADKNAIVKAQGADHVIGTANLKDDVKALTDGKGVDVVYDGVGGEISALSLRAMKFGGRFLIVGWAATPGQVNTLPTNLIMMKGIDVLGCPTVISTQHDPSIRPARLGQVMAWVRSGQLKPLVARTYSLDEFRTAMHAKWNGETVGGICLRP